MFRGHLIGNYNLGVDVTVSVEFMQQFDENINTNRRLSDFQQKHATGVNRRCFNYQFSLLKDYYPYQKFSKGSFIKDTNAMAV